MTMTKKDFEIIQAAVRDAKDCLPTGPVKAGIDEVVDALVFHISRDQPGFDSERFIRGCDPQQFAEDQKEEGWL